MARPQTEPGAKPQGSKNRPKRQNRPPTVLQPHLAFGIAQVVLHHPCRSCITQTFWDRPSGFASPVPVLHHPYCLSIAPIVLHSEYVFGKYAFQACQERIFHARVREIHVSGLLNNGFLHTCLRNTRFQKFHDFLNNSGFARNATYTTVW